MKMIKTIYLKAQDFDREVNDFLGIKEGMVAFEFLENKKGRLVYLKNGKIVKRNFSKNDLVKFQIEKQNKINAQKLREKGLPSAEELVGEI